VSVYDEGREGSRRSLAGTAWAGRISSNPEELDVPVYVIIPGFSEDHQFGPCRWQSRNATDLPQRGDACFVQFDDEHQPWVTAWWPF
jgi:hypothetical protein